MAKSEIILRSMRPVLSREVSRLFGRVRDILEAARCQTVRSVNTLMVQAYWLIGREIVEVEQKGRRRAHYGEQLIDELSRRLTSNFGKGWNSTTLKRIRQLYLTYPKGAALRHQSASRGTSLRIGASVRHFSAQDWLLSWTHYRLLIGVESPYARNFYEIEAIRNSWSSRQLERQVNSLLFERLAKSRDKRGLMALAQRGQEIEKPQDAIKDPVVLEFLGIPESARLVESKLEEALLNDLQTFLLELGKGFAFVARQQRLTLEGDHFYVDLVFYHTILKCHVLIDLKMVRLTHADLGQMQLYVNYYNQHYHTEGDNPTIGLILCTDKNDAVVKYTLGDGNPRIFASRYKLHLPSEKELADEIRRELRQLQQPT